ncbi:MAG: 30S ribosomal protein S4 [Deltaproteobacteria bacterium]|nr:30S ribosomal protein S4 [Deltaproteobacteria bacterium]
MARYTGPKLKLMRSVGLHLPGLSRKSIERKPNPPGMRDGQFRRKKSDYGLHLLEKQKLRFNYGVTEKYLRKTVREAFRSREHSGHKLLELLERRLDSMLFRAGLAPSIPAARQLVRHNHVLVDGKRVNIPSYRVDPGQEITMTAKGLKIPVVSQVLEQPVLARPAWLAFDAERGAAKMIAVPDRESFSFPIEVNLIVEFYARSVK